MSEKPAGKRNVKLAFPQDASAAYSNMVMITHTAHEVIFDFIQVMPSDDRARVQQRIMMTPTHSKLFLHALQDNIAKYEAKHGEIAAAGRQTLADQLFGGLGPGPGEDDDE